MDFGILSAKIDEIGYISHAENLGYSHCWVSDSSMIRSHCFAVLALAAQATRTMKLGTGVSVPGLRLAPVTANGIATINRLAPGRTFLSLGTGNTAMRTLGHRPMALKPFAEYIRVVRALLRGEEVDYELSGKSARIAFQMREFRYVELEPQIPVYIAGFGPKAQALAGELGDGLLSGYPRGGTIAQAVACAAQGAKRAGRSMDGFYTTALMNVALLEPGEPVDSPRVIDQVGSAVMTNMHYFVARHDEVGAEPPPFVRGIWEDYLTYLNQRPPEARHRLLHESHYTYLNPEEARFLTPELIRGMCLIGTPEELVQRIRALEGEGLNQIIVYPPLDRMYRVTEDFAEKVMARL